VPQVFENLPDGDSTAQVGKIDKSLLLMVNQIFGYAFGDDLADTSNSPTDASSVRFGGAVDQVSLGGRGRKRAALPPGLDGQAGKPMPRLGEPCTKATSRCHRTLPPASSRWAVRLKRAALPPGF
jgi:hypothetical protein